MVCDVSPAFFYAPVQHEEDSRRQQYVCKATHEHAAQNWQEKVQETMATLGVTIGKASPVRFCHLQRSLKCLVHGDDFVVSGEPVDLFFWMRNELESKVEINTTILGDEPAMSKEVKILNRKLCWHDGSNPMKQTRNMQKKSSVKQERPI